MNIWFLPLLSPPFSLTSHYFPNLPRLSLLSRATLSLLMLRIKKMIREPGDEATLDSQEGTQWKLRDSLFHPLPNSLSSSSRFIGRTSPFKVNFFSHGSIWSHYTNFVILPSQLPLPSPSPLTHFSSSRSAFTGRTSLLRVTSPVMVMSDPMTLISVIPPFQLPLPLLPPSPISHPPPTLTGRTSPLRVTSPVMAVSDLTQRPLKSEARTVTIVIPAEGPSLPTAPAGKWMWMSMASRLPQENPYCKGMIDRQITQWCLPSLSLLLKIEDTNSYQPHLVNNCQLYLHCKQQKFSDKRSCDHTHHLPHPTSWGCWKCLNNLCSQTQTKV